MLFFMLFVAAIDNIPDPPAVIRHNSVSVSASILHVRAPSSLQQEILLAFASPQYTRTASSASRLTIENRLLGFCHILLIRHSADPSPPILS
jgi:hypothetical protein